MDGAVTLGTAPLNTGTASFSTAALATGNHSITAVYGGDTLYNTSTSTPLAQSVVANSTSTSITSSTNPSALEQSVIFTATVTSSGGTPTGTVTFMDGTTSLGTSSLNGSGQATFATTVLTPGNHSITANYSGDTNFSAGVSAVLTQTVNIGTSSTALTSSVNPSSFGQAVTFTATVSGLVIEPTGTVTFMDGATVLGTGNLNAGGQATFTTSGLSAGGHSITAVYGGNSFYNSSTSNLLIQTVNQDTSTTAISSSSNPSALGTSITFSATVTGTGVTPTGTVTFKDGATTLGTGTLSGGQATFATNALSVGTHSITATYGGDTNYSGSVSPTLTQTVTVNSSATAIGSSANPSALGQSVTFTATVTSSSGTPTGTVAFKDGATTLGSGTLNGSGQATFSTSALTAGSHSITASYGGDSNYASSVSSVLMQTVTQGSSTTSVTSSLNPSSYGAAMTFTATVNGVGGSPTGTVTFKDGATTLGTGTLNSGEQASLSVNSLAVGGHSITAVYGGDANFPASTSPALVQNVTTGSSGTTLSSSANPSTCGQAVTFTATVSAGAGGTPTGTVTFKDGTTTLGAAALNGNGQTTLSVNSLSAGSHSITASYGGDSNFATSVSSVLTQTVNQGSSTTSVTSSLNPSSYGAAVTFTATVNGAGGSPTGTVTFKDGATTLGTGALNSGEQASFSVNSLTVGGHSITAAYGGDSNFPASTSPALVQNVTTGSSGTTLSSSANPSALGQAVTFTATVSAGAGGTPAGTVTFKDGTTTLGTGTLNGSGQTTFAVSSLLVGSHSITASYGGDSNFAGSVSPVLTQTINQGSSTTSVASSLNPSSYGTAVTFTATVNGVGGSPTGTVTFKDGATTLGTGALNGGGQASLSISSLTVGGHSITAVYGGDANFPASTSPALIQNATAGSSGTTLISSANPSAIGQAVTFTANVSAGAGGPPTGTVTFKDGTTTLGTAALNGNGQATFAVSSLSVGSHSITANYGGDTNFPASTSPVLTQAVTANPSSTAIASSANPSTFGQSVTWMATVSGSGGVTPTGTVTFKDGTTTLGTATLNGSAQATFTPSTLAVGAHSMTASYGGDSNFASSVSPTVSQSVNQTSSGTSLTSSINPSAYHATVTFTAIVSGGGGGTPTGTVTFKNGATILGSAAVNGSGQATLSTGILAAGAQTISASYGGDVNFPASTSPTLIQTVNQNAAAISLTSSVNPSALGKPVTFTATVTSSGGTPTGTVTFKDGNTAIGTAALAGSAAMFTTSSLPVGNHSIVAVYGGDGNFTAITSAALAQSVDTPTDSIGCGNYR